MNRSQGVTSRQSIASTYLGNTYGADTMGSTYDSNYPYLNSAMVGLHPFFMIDTF